MMRGFRIATEGLLRFGFWMARAAFLTQGLAMATALLSAPWLGHPETPPWLDLTVRNCLWVGATLFATGVLLVVAPNLPVPRAAAGTTSTWPWALLLGLTLIGLPALAGASSSDLLALWREIGGRLHDIGFWDELKRSSQFSGVVLLPILAALFVPALETAAAFFLIAVPLALVVLLLARSPRFPRLFTMMVVSQAGLVLAGLLASDAFSALATQATGAMAAAPDAEVHALAEELERAAHALDSTATAFVAPMVGYLVWCPFLLLSHPVGSFFAAGAEEPASLPQPPFEPAPVLPAPSASPHSEPRRAPKRARAASRPMRVFLVGLGALMLAFGACDSLRPRARYVSSEPAAGSTVSSPPTAVRVTFGLALDPASSLSVTRLMPEDGESPIPTRSALDPQDSRQRTLKVELSGMTSGLYRVEWRAFPAEGGIARYGSFAFGVGSTVPASGAGGQPVLQERDGGELRHRDTVAGGAILIMLALVLPRPPGAARERSPRHAAGR